MIEAFKAIRFRPATLALIDHANEIIDEYQALGFILTLRQLFYQFVSRPALGLANTFDELQAAGPHRHRRAPGRPDRLGRASRTAPATFARLPTWDDPPEIVGACADAISRGPLVVAAVSARGLDREGRPDRRDRGRQRGIPRPYFSCRGNVSESGDVRRGQTLRGGNRPRPSSDRPAARRPRSQRPRHDARHSRAPRDVRPPGNRGQAPRAQSRSDHRPAAQLRQGEATVAIAAYVRQFGTTDCWELDALAPNVISGLVRAELEGLIDAGRMGERDRGRGRQSRRSDRRRR